MSHPSAYGRRHPLGRRLIAAVLCLLLAGLCAGGLNGCKHSDVLTELIEDEAIGVLDETMEPIYRDVLEGTPDDSRTSSVLTQSDRIDEQAQNNPDYGEADDPEQETDNRDHDEEDQSEREASEGDEPTEAEGESSQAGEGNEAGSASAGAEGAEGENGDIAQETAGPGSDGSVPDGGRGGTGQAYDATGEFAELPEGLESIAAAGPYATIVQMIGGRGGLAAADREWIDAVSAGEVFPDEGVENLVAAWEGGAATGYDLNMEVLLAAHPDAVLTDGVHPALGDEERAALSEAGIDVVTVPALGATDTPDEDILAAVSVVGELLKDAPTALDASMMTDYYRSAHDEALESCLDANGGYSYKMIYGTAYRAIYQGTSAAGIDTARLSSNRTYTAYIDSWSQAVNAWTEAVRTYSDFSLYLNGQPMDASEGVGLSATGSSGNFQLLDYYLQVSGVVNNSYEGAKPVVSADTGMTSPYLIAAGDTRLLVTAAMSAASRTVPSALWFCPTTITAGTRWSIVGDADFPAILVKDESMALKVAESAAKENGLYNVGQPYEIRIVPAGFSGSWADGTVESFLAAPWAYGVFHGGDLSAASTYAEDFYQLFYRCSAADAVAGYNTVYQAACPRG